MPAADASYSRRWLSLAVASVAQAIVLIDGTTVNIALRSAQRALHSPNGDGQWVVTAIGRRETRPAGEERPRLRCDDQSVPCDEGFPARRRT